MALLRYLSRFRVASGCAFYTYKSAIRAFIDSAQAELNERATHGLSSCRRVFCIVFLQQLWTDLCNVWHVLYNYVKQQHSKQLNCTLSRAVSWLARTADLGLHPDARFVFDSAIAVLIKNARFQWGLEAWRVTFCIVSLVSRYGFEGGMLLL